MTTPSRSFSFADVIYDNTDFNYVSISEDKFTVMAPWASEITSGSKDYCGYMAVPV